MASGSARETRAFANEIKFHVPRATAAAIREWARRHLDPDPHGGGPFEDEYCTRTIYFETAAYDVFHRRGSFGRSKYRIRQYDGTAEVFLERKLRRPGMLTKRRTPVRRDDLARLDAEADGAWAGSWFHRRLLVRGLHPVCEISYRRTARAGVAGGAAVRLTLDEGLRVSRAEEPVFSNGEGVPVLDGTAILELKYLAQVPALFKGLVQDFALQPQPTSKYRLGIAVMDPDGTNATAATAVRVGGHTAIGGSTRG